MQSNIPLDSHSIRFCVSKQVSFRQNEVNFMANKTRQMSKVECTNYIKLHVLTLNSNELMCLPRSYFVYFLPPFGLFLYGFSCACFFLLLANFLARNQGANYCWKKFNTFRYSQSIYISQQRKYWKLSTSERILSKNRMSLSTFIVTSISNS